MKLISKNILSYLLTLIILFFIIYYFIQNWKSLQSVTWWENPLFLGGHIVLSAFTFTLSAIGWHRLLMATGNNLGFKVSGHIWLISNIGKYIPGKVFMFAGRIALLSRFGIRKSTAIGNIIWEHIFIILAIMPFIFITLINYDGTFPLKLIIASTCVLILILVIALNPAIIQRVINFVLRIFQKPPLELVLQRKTMLGLFIFYFLLWIIYGFSGVSLAYAFGFEDKTSMLLIFNVYIFSWFIGFISIITPGGLGIREGVLILMVSPYVSTTELIVYVLLARMIWVVIEGAGIIVGMILGNKLNTQRLNMP